LPPMPRGIRCSSVNTVLSGVMVNSPETSVRDARLVGPGVMHPAVMALRLALFDDDLPRLHHDALAVAAVRHRQILREILEAFDQFGDGEVYTKDASKWWNGYREQKCILFDDWVGSSEIPPHALLQICDRYPLQVQSKGGYVKMAARTEAIVFTYNICMTEWYGYNKPEWEKGLPAFRRRLSRINEEIADEPVVKTEIVDADNQP